MQLLTSAGLFLAAPHTAGLECPSGRMTPPVPTACEHTNTRGRPHSSENRANRSEGLVAFPVMWRAGAASPSPTELVVTRAAERMCQSNLDIPDKGVTEDPPLGIPITIVAQDSGHLSLIRRIENLAGGFDVP
jgi:hypothetical protein